MPGPAYFDLYDGDEWWGVPYSFQNLALSVNVTTLNNLGLMAPPPINATYWLQPDAPASMPPVLQYGSTWTPAEFRDYCILLNKAGVEECWISEEVKYRTQPHPLSRKLDVCLLQCMIDSQIPALAGHYGITTITANGSVGWRDPVFIDFLVDVLIPIMNTSKPMSVLVEFVFVRVCPAFCCRVARWLDLGKNISQEFLMTPSDQWPPWKTYYIPRGTCSLATQVSLSVGPSSRLLTVPLGTWLHDAVQQPGPPRDAGGLLSRSTQPDPDLGVRRWKHDHRGGGTGTVFGRACFDSQ